MSLAPAPRPLPIGAAFRHALESIWYNRRPAFLMSWPWFALIAAAFLVIRIAMPDPRAAAGAYVASQIAVSLLALFAYSSVAVNWHRYVLRDEIPAPASRLRMDDTVWRYFGTMMLILLILIGVFVLITVPLTLIAALAGSAQSAGVLIGLIGLPFMGIAFFRFGIKLPAVALGEAGFSLADAWRRTAGNDMRLAGLFCLNILGVVLVSLPLVALRVGLSAVSPGLAETLSFAAEVIANWFVTMFGITMLTSLYGFFVERRDF
jgi:hypothetical protein